MGQRIQLPVYMYSQCLKTACGRVLARLAAANGRLDQIGQLQGAGNRLLLALFADTPGNPTRLALIAIAIQHIGNILLVGPGQPLRNTFTLSWVHAHIQRPITQKAEATTGIVQLRRRHTQIQQQAINGATHLVYHIRQAVKAAGHDLETAIFRCQLLTRGNGLGITIDTGKAPLCVQLFQQCTAVATSPKGAIHIKAITTAEPHIQYLFQHHRLVFVLRALVGHQKDNSCTLSGNASGSRVPSSSNQLSAFQISKRCI